MNDGIVVEVGWTAREVDLISREFERLANETGCEVALDTLTALVEVVPEYLPEYVRASVARMGDAREAQGRLWGIRGVDSAARRAVE